MHSVALRPTDFAGWRAATRDLIHADVQPDQVEWLEEGASGSLFGEHPAAATATGTGSFAVPRSFVGLASMVALHKDPGRFALLYRLLWRLRREPHLMSDALDADVARAGGMRKSVERDIHKMHAFVRFREFAGATNGFRIAWFEPEHHILEAAAPFFVRRFANFPWSILTPELSAHWDTHALSLGPGGRSSDAPAEDAHEALWRTYYASIFNPARLKPAAMRQHMPKKYWRNLPETQAVSSLVHEAPERMRAMIEKEAAMPSKRDPEKAVAAMSDQDPKTLKALNKLIAASEPLVPGADHAVLGEGPEGAAIAFVGEQPGDQEDLAGRPFVGPAGKLLDQALEEAGIDRKSVYVTNAVKHFKFEPRGKRRIHQKPTMGEVKRYRWWLMKELDLVHPKLVVALGGTAAAALSGKAVSVTKARGKTSFENRPGFITVHPSYLLRIPDADAKDEAYKEFVADLRKVRSLAA